MQDTMKLTESRELVEKLAASNNLTVAEIKEGEITANSIAKPRLEKARLSPISSLVEYLKGEPGVFKKGYIMGTGPGDVVDPRTGEVKIMECFFFMEEVVSSDGAVNYNKFVNASKLLVDTAKRMIDSGEIIPNNFNFPVGLSFKGMKMGKTNEYAVWDLRPLIFD